MPRYQQEGDLEMTPEEIIVRLDNALDEAKAANKAFFNTVEFAKFSLNPDYQEDLLDRKVKATESLLEANRWALRILEHNHGQRDE